MKKLLKSLFCLTLFFSLVLVVSSCKKTEPVETTPESNPVTDGPSNVTTDVDLLDLFQDDGSGVYTATKEDGKLNVAVNKGVTEGTEWASLKADLSGKDLSKIQSLRFNIGGTCQVKLKIQSTAGGKEVDLALSTALAYEWDLSGADEQAILAESDVLVLVFAIPGKAQGEGSFTLTNIVLSEEEAMFNPIQSGHTNISNDVNNYDGTSATFDFNSLWTENDGGTYTFSDAADGVEVEFNVTGWQFAYSPIAGAFGKFDYVTFKVTGTVGQSVLFKVEKSPVIKEAKVEFNGSEQVISIDLTSFNDADIAALPRVLFFANSGQKGAGTFTIHEAYFGTEDETDLGGAPELGEDERKIVYEGGYYNEFNLNKNWYSGDEGVYTVTNDKSPWVIEWTKAENQNWAPIKIDIQGNFGNFETLSIGLELPKDMKAVVSAIGPDGIKAENNQIVGTGECAGFTVDLKGLTVEQRDKLTNVLVYVNTDVNDANTGTVKIHWACFKDFKYRGIGQALYTDPKQTSLDLNNVWSGDSCYTLSREDGQPWVVSYSKAKGQEWVNIHNYVFGNKLGNFTQLKAGLKVAEGKQVLIKVEGDGWNIEYWYTGTGSYDGDIVVDLTKKGETPITVEQRNTIKMVLLFAEGGKAGTDDVNLDGSFEIHWMKFDGYKDQDRAPLYVEGTVDSFSVNAYFKPLDQGVYTVTEADGKSTVEYAKTGQWNFMITYVGGDFSQFNQLSYNFTSTTAEKVMIKIEGTAGNVELKVNCNEAGVIDLTEHAAKIAGMTKVLICIDYEKAGTADAPLSGTFVIETLEFGKKASE